MIYFGDATTHHHYTKIIVIIAVLNVIVLSTMQNSNKLLSEPVFLLLANVSVSNIAISIFVKLMSVILCGYQNKKILTSLTHTISVTFLVACVIF